MEITHRQVAATGGQDRFALLCNEHRFLFILADGAGGTVGGALAATLVCDLALRHAEEPGLVDWSQVLQEIDETLGAHPEAGWSTGVIVEVYDGEVRGASVGDSAAWLLSGGGVENLTQYQRRKPMLGTQQSLPVYFGPYDASDRILLMGSDGLFGCAKQTSIERCLHMHATNLEGCANALAELATLPSGEFSDDFTLLLAKFGVGEVGGS